MVVKALRPFGTSIFSEMTGLSNRCGAINLSQGFPDFDGPEEIKAKAAEAILKGPNQYAPSIGIEALRLAVARKMKRFYGLDVDPDREITVTSGATEGLCATLLGILEPEDEVILLEPVYDVYPPICGLTHAKIRYLSLEGPDYRLPAEKLEKAFNPRTKAIVINNPQNPCTKVFSPEELALVSELCNRYDAYVVADEVYEYLVFDGHAHIPMISVPGLRERAFVISSTAKTFSMTGWKIGYVAAAPELTRAVRMVHQFLTFSGQGPLQEAMAFAIDFPDPYYREFIRAYTRKRDRLAAALSDLGFRVFMPEGTYYVNVDISSLGFEDDLAFCRKLTEEAGVAAIPCSYFWKDRKQGRNLARFCFCKREETLDEAARRLKKWLK